MNRSIKDSVILSVVDNATDVAMENLSISQETSTKGINKKEPSKRRTSSERYKQHIRS